jgi:hypothetical protein
MPQQLLLLAVAAAAWGSTAAIPHLTLAPTGQQRRQEVRLALLLLVQQGAE